MHKCPFCSKTDSVKSGLRKNKSGFVQRYFCNKCKRLYVDRKGFENMQTNPEIVITALDLRAQGLSYGKICKHIKQKYRKTITRSAVLHWQNKFGEMIDNFTKSFQLSHSFDAHADEVFLREKGQRNRDFIYYWDCIDYETKFLVGDHISYERDEFEGRQFMEKVKANIKEFPKRIHTDNSYDYPPAIRKTFGRGKVKHVHFPAWKMKFKNNPIERFHNTLKENYKVMRRFFKIETAYKFLRFFRNYYNFIRVHKSLDWKTPAQAAGFGKWNWYTLIKAFQTLNQFTCC